MTNDEMRNALVNLLDREAIRDVMARYARAVDRFDRDLLRSVYHPDAIDDHAGFVGDRDELWQFVRRLHGEHHRVTQHFIANHIAEIDGPCAHAETYFLFAAMNKEGQPFSMLGGRYVDRLEKRRGVWGIVSRISLGEWAAPSVNTAEAAKSSESAANRNYLEPYMLEVIAGQPKPARDHSDPSYDRPLLIEPSRKVEHDRLRKEAADRARNDN